MVTMLLQHVLHLGRKCFQFIFRFFLLLPMLSLMWVSFRTLGFHRNNCGVYSGEGKFVVKVFYFIIQNSVITLKKKKELSDNLQKYIKLGNKQCNNSLFKLILSQSHRTVEKSECVQIVLLFPTHLFLGKVEIQRFKSCLESRCK